VERGVKTETRQFLMPKKDQAFCALTGFMKGDQDKKKDARKAEPADGHIARVVQVPLGGGVNNKNGDNQQTR